MQTPVRIITGRGDLLVPLRNAEFLHERLPNNSLPSLMPATSREDATDEYTALVDRRPNAGHTYANR
jgi:hypothetical protein